MSVDISFSIINDVITGQLAFKKSIIKLRKAFSCYQNFACLVYRYFCNRMQYFASFDLLPLPTKSSADWHDAEETELHGGEWRWMALGDVQIWHVRLQYHHLRWYPECINVILIATQNAICEPRYFHLFCSKLNSKIVIKNNLILYFGW